MIAMIDYDAGNLQSVKKAFDFLGQEITVTREPEIICRADKVILPGVGAFGEAMNKLNRYHLVDTLKEVAGQGTPFFGICLGLQLMFESSEECPGTRGLGILKGKIKRIPAKEGWKIPHMGWNSLSIQPGTRLFDEVPDQSYVYFVHSYYLEAEEKAAVAATTEYSVRIDAAVEKDNIFACQFHPEKSSQVGLQILHNFAKL